MAFARTFAKAATNQQVREVLKKESALSFDKDHDVLFARVKNNRLNARHTLYSYIDSLSRDEISLSEITRDLPLLTVYVGTYLNSKNWDTKTEVPVVAVRDKQDKLIAFNRVGEHIELNPLEEPLAPIVVVKDNERVVATGPRSHSPVVKFGDFLLEDEGTKYYFLDNEYNGLNPYIYSRTSTSNRTVVGSATNTIDYKIKEAFGMSQSCPSCAQRDWIYYNIGAYGPLIVPQGEGPLNYNYEEAITAMRFENLGGFETIGGWDEGNFEFWINGFFGGTTPTLEPIFKNLSARAEDLLNFHTETRRASGWSGFFGGTVTVRVADSPKEYTFGVPVKFVPWDMQKYGDTWGMVIEEYDLTVNETLTYKHVTTVGTNFEVKAGEPTKVGGTFGVTTTNVKESTAEYKSQTGNDRLGNVRVSYKSPVITSLTVPGPLSADPGTVRTNELSSGSLILSFETVRVR